METAKRKVGIIYIIIIFSLTLVVSYLSNTIDIYDLIYYSILVLFVLTPIYIKVKSDNNYREKIKILPVESQIIFLSFLYSVLSFLTNVLFLFIFQSPEPKEYIGSIFYYIFALIIKSILSPIAEELIFRGLLFNWLQRYGIKVSMIISSLLFGIMHGFSLMHFASGLLYAYFIYKFNSILPGIIIHISHNALFYLFYNNNLLNSLLKEILFYLNYDLLAFIIVFVILLLFIILIIKKVFSIRMDNM